MNKKSLRIENLKVNYDFNCATYWMTQAHVLIDILFDFINDVRKIIILLLNEELEVNFQ